jgi:hypothetical protein
MPLFAQSTTQKMRSSASLAQIEWTTS